MGTPQVTQYCRDFFNEDAEIWESALLRCAHCRHKWVGVFLMRLTSLECPYCHKTTRKNVIEEI